MPIAIKVDNKYYDAGLYGADPYPMALGQGTVYEAERAGNSVGLFTVTGVQNVKNVWTGAGQWRPNHTPEAEAKKTRPEPAPANSDEPPILRRSKPTNETKSVPPPASVPESKPTATEAGPGASTQSRSASTSASPDEDTERPILRRGKPAAKAEDEELATLNPGKRPTSTAPPLTANVPADKTEVLIAVSDVSRPAPHSYVIPLGTEQRVRDEGIARQMAYEAIRKFAVTHPQHRPAAPTALTEVQFNTYDAQTNNECTLILSASLPELSSRGTTSDFRYFVTVVGRIDMYGEAHSLLARVSDSTHLDAYPRMEFIDIVDAEGSGSGQLLFRQISDTGHNYVLYRIGLDKLWPLFEGAGKNF